MADCFFVPELQQAPTSAQAAAQFLLQWLLPSTAETLHTRGKDIVSGKLVIADRCKIANNANVDYLVSIHANAAQFLLQWLLPSTAETLHQSTVFLPHCC